MALEVVASREDTGGQGGASGHRLLALYAGTAFLGAGLLFLVQPMIAKLVLPRYGGTPAVWNTASMFFQVLLLGGYLMTHLLLQRLGVRRHALLQVLLALLPLAALPVALHRGPPSGGEPPVLTLVLLLATAVGAPFLLLSTGGPLLQRWFASTNHPRARDPYFLYAAGNAGSLLGLLGYPLLVEPHWSLAQQRSGWSAAYCVWALLLAGCAVPVLRGLGGVSVREPSPQRQLAWREQLRWVGLAALASSLMLGTTTYITTDLAPVPLLWVLPLSLYLGSFIVAFALPKPAAAVWWPRLGRAVPVLLVPTVVATVMLGRHLFLVLPLYLALFALLATTAHTRLSAERPEVASLTRFYLLLALGGALGGTVNGMLAPVLLNRMYEVPVVLIASLVLVPGVKRPGWLSRRFGPVGLLPVVLVVAAAPVVLSESTGELPAAVVVLLAGSAAVLLGRHRGALAVGLGLVLLIPLVVEPRLATTRSFFGVQEVMAANGRHVLMHGTTVHGWQDTRPERRRLAQSYYEASGPAGQVLGPPDARLEGARIGVVGLGSGTLAAYGRAGQRFRFFEIDPETVRLARDRRLFTYLEDTAATVDVVLGDGRLSLAAEPPASFDVLVLDAFSSDAVPVHLLTREAMRLYLSRLRPGGRVLLHISNRYLELGGVLADVVAAEGAHGLLQQHQADDAAGGSTSRWVVVTREQRDLAPLANDSRWVPLQAFQSRHRPWTDDYSDLLRALLER